MDKNEVKEQEMQEEPGYYTSEEALEVAKKSGINVTHATLLIWIDKRKLGFQPGGPGSRWCIYKDKFDLFVKGKLERGHANG